MLVLHFLTSKLKPTLNALSKGRTLLWRYACKANASKAAYCLRSMNMHFTIK